VATASLTRTTEQLEAKLADDRELAHIIRKGLPAPGDVTVLLGFDLMLGIAV
jgi:hypothetical protein